MAEEIKETTGDLLNVGNAAGFAAEGVKKYGMAMIEAIKSSVTTKAMLDEIAKAFGGVQKVATYAADSFEKIGIKNVGLATAAAIGAMTKSIPDATKAFGDLGKAGGMAGRDLSDSLKTLQPYMEKMPGGKTFMMLANGMSESANAGTNLQKSIIGIYASSGNLNQLLADSGTKFKNLNDVSTAYSESLSKVSMATGVSSSQVNSLVQGLQNIPGILDEQSIQAGRASNSMNNMVAILRVQAATGMSTAAVTENLNFAYETLGLKGEGALEILAQMSEVSKDSGLPLQAVSKYVQETGNAFKYFGDNTQTAMGALSRLLPGLKDAKLGYGAIKDILSNVTGSMADLNVGQRAFISGQSGGVGGLQGSFKMLNDLSTGKGADVFKRYESAFKNKLGGPMVTLKQAGEDPGAAVQFQKQLSMLQEMGMKGDEKTLAKISDAFAKPGSLNTADKTTMLENVLGRGADYQERTVTGIDLMVSHLERMSMLAAIQNSLTMRMAFGADGAKGPVADFVKSAMEHNARLAGTIGVTAQDKEKPDLAKIQESAKNFLTANMEGLFAGYESEKAEEEAAKKPGAKKAAVKEESKEFSFFNLIKGFGIGGKAETLPEAITAPPKISPTTAPPTPKATLAPAPISKATSTVGEATATKAGEKQLGILKVLIDTSFYENGMRKIAHEEGEIALGNSNVRTIIGVGPA